MHFWTPFHVWGKEKANSPFFVNVTIRRIFPRPEKICKEMWIRRITLPPIITQYLSNVHQVHSSSWLWKGNHRPTLQPDGCWYPQRMYTRCKWWLLGNGWRSTLKAIPSFTDIQKAFKILEDLVSIHSAPQVDNGFVLTTPLWQCYNMLYRQ